MTKFMEWLTVIGCVFCIWAALVTNKIETSFTRDHYTSILFSPIIALGLFGVYAVTTVLYKTFTFNNCEEAAVQLQKEIEMAKDDLKQLGFNFKN
ncbi:hypothetical protein RN001_010460 [Aquatica leii]|uniref:Dolichol-phosphate mannosyltransferase subunit 3 n=1 Tax=Aquatica leii TaxID=1421715 RepID=A0AAN7PUV5_9COLE|nr:hypothetical protein RN001_010460 [Aquatica leii]